MALSPLDIHNKEFNVRLRGYDQDQVNDFLSQIIKDYSALLKDNEALQKQLDDANEKVKYFSDMKDALNQSIIVAQEAADKVKNNAQDEAQIIQQKAEKSAQDMLSSATEKTNKVLNDAQAKQKEITVQTEDLKKQTRVFRQRLQVMLESQLEVVKSPEWKEMLASANEDSDYLDPADNPDLDRGTADSLDSEPAPDATNDQTYTEIVFPSDEPDSEAQSTTSESTSDTVPADQEATDSSDANSDDDNSADEY